MTRALPSDPPVDLAEVIGEAQEAMAQHQERAAASWREQAKDDLTEQLWRARGSIPELLRWARFGAPEMAERVSVPKAIGYVRDLEVRRVVTFAGPSGVGKSSLAVATLAQLLDAATIESPEEIHWAARRARFIATDQIADAVVSRRLGEGARRAVHAATEASLLVLDDLGLESSSAPVREALTALIVTRHRHGRRTIVTTGFDLEELGARYGAGVQRRLVEETFLDLGASLPARGAGR